MAVLGDVYGTSQRRILDQETFFTRNLKQPLMKNTYLFDNYAYGWIPETAIWSSRYANLDASEYYPISLGLLKKFEFLMSLYNGPVQVYEEKVNTEFIENGSFSGRYVSYLRKFSSLPTNEFISFLLLTSIPIYNILFWFKNTQFDITKHTLFRHVYTTNNRHLELARYIHQTGDYKPLFSRLKENYVYTGPLPIGVRTINHPNLNARNNPSDYETLSNLSTILYFTNYDPVLMFLAFYVPGYSITTKITPAVEYLMNKLNLTIDDVTII
ncbi:ER-localized membrane protein virion core protein [NY_014 poxvirus]|uniref:ER-localized membrane protein virion core protein n=1 Tax=NY_014 poxvirus TaxID=2025360 RepID=UPI000B99FABC|nr:ER-localized membrane protein virion core protein [NY_014 poxvirus]AST09456.1 ER-localized membrane protein virion core protein [NY_014 poxvirus]